MSEHSYRLLYSTDYHQAHLNWVKQNKLIYRHYKKQYQKLIQPRLGLRLLEFGCSSGKTSCDLAKLGCRVTAVDFDPSAIALAQEWAAAQGCANQVEFICCSAEEFKIRSAAYDVITMLDFVEHVPDSLLRQVFSNIKTSGYLGDTLVFTPNRLHFSELLRQWGVVGQDPTHINLKSEGEWREFFASCGYKVHSSGRVSSHWPALSAFEQFAKELPLIGSLFSRSLAFRLRLLPKDGARQ